jgi:precorrin-6B methylase 2
MSVTVTTWAELITALSGSDAIVWGGSANITSVTVDVASDHLAQGNIVVNAPSIDFNGLTIGTLSTAAPNGRDFKTNGSVSQKLDAWMSGF